MTYPRISSKWCSKHKPPAVNLWQTIRRVLGKSYRYRNGVHCDCPSVAVVPPSTYAQFG